MELLSMLDPSGVTAAVTCLATVTRGLIYLAGPGSPKTIKLKDELESLVADLESFRAFLLDDERTGQNSNLLTNLVVQVKDSARDVEDMLELLMYYQRRENSWSSTDTTYMKDHLKKTKNDVQNISRRIKYFGQTAQPAPSGEETNGRRLWQPPQTTHDETACWEWSKKKPLPGMEQEEAAFLGWLRNGTTGNPTDKVISICGMGGSGKTALTRRLYNSDAVKGIFKCSAWISLSQPYDIEQVMQSIITQVHKPGKLPALPDNLDLCSRETLLHLLHVCLDKKKYLIVLDGVRSRDALNEFARLLQIGDAGSRVVVTTRDHQLGSLLSAGRMLNLRSLADPEAWSLFCSKAFPLQPENCCPKDLEASAKKILAKCEGLPLGIETLGRLMSSKDPDALTWNKFYNTISYSLSNEELLIKMSRILMLDFHTLSYHKKQCYLYCCSVFPVDYIIKKNWLIRLWVAEGLVEEIPGITLEEVAEAYFDELVRHSLLQVAKGKVEGWRVHALMREISLSATGGEGLCLVSDERGITAEDKARRVSIQKCIKQGMEIGTVDPRFHLRSLVSFVNDEASADSFIEMSAKFRLLKVLELRDLPIDRLPVVVVKWYNLKYLSLRKTKVEKLPECIERFQMLETLDTRGSKIATVSSKITSLKNLRHLLMGHARTESEFTLTFGKPQHSWVGDLRSLLTLKIEADSDQRIVEEVAKLTQLRRLGLKNMKQDLVGKLCHSLSTMSQLLSLTIRAASDETLKLDSLTSLPSDLRKIVLDGKMQRLPSCFSHLSSLTHLYLLNSQLEDDSSNRLPQLGKLEKLVHLTLQGAYMGKKLCFGAEEFVHLKSLVFAELEGLKELVVQKGALLRLTMFEIRSCHELLRFDGSRNLHIQCHLRYKDMPKKFASSLSKRSMTEEVNSMPMGSTSHRP